MKGISKFQLILTGVFVLLIVLGVLVFALKRGGSNGQNLGPVLVWGTMDSEQFDNFLKNSKISDDKTVAVTYVQKNKATFDTDFIEGLASQNGPDLFLLQQDSIVKHQDKVLTIPFSSYPERTFKEGFVQEGELFLTSKGSLALPFMIDPMVTYWNRDIFSNAGLSVPPKNWSELYDLAAKLTKKDTGLNISQTALALGEYANIANAQEIISLLTMQAGNPIVVRRTDDTLMSIFGERLEFPVAPANRAVSFYTDFSNPLKPYYSWNRSLPNSKNYFLSGDLAIYFGFASEAAELRQKNPNLNFDIAPILQSKDSPNVITFGKMTGLAVPKTSKNVAGAFKVAYLMTATNAIAELSKVTGLPPVRRDLLAVKPSVAFMSVFYDGAIQSRGWLSPEASKVSPIFREMIESITSGREMPSEAITKTNSQLNASLK